MPTEPNITKRHHLIELGEAYLAERVSLRQFRRNLTHMWYNLSRTALAHDEARLWAEILDLAEELDRDTDSSEPTDDLFDESFLRESVAAALGIDAKPASGAIRRRAREVKQAIATVLLHDWDPIGISDIPDAADEYDSYVGAIYRLLAGGTTPEELALFLRDIEVNRMGIVRSKSGVLLAVARKLLRIDVALSRGSV